MAATENLPGGEKDVRAVKPTLLAKYNIPVNFLDFDYIRRCKDGREMEKIYHVLQSGEEGHFPALLQTAEDRLRELAPKSKFLRKTVPVLTRQTMEKDEWKRLTEDLGDWVASISKSDKELSGHKMVPVVHEEKIRKCNKKLETDESEKRPNPNRIRSTDYASWDKYDPDTEILKQDLEEKRVKEVARNINKISVNKEPKRSAEIKQPPTTAEAVFQANNEKDKGNESYKAGEYENALEHYSRSIILNPTAAVYNNRAITNIKLKQFSNAINDCHEVLDKEPRNVKALLRKAQALEALDFFEDALKSVEKAITIEPNNCMAQNMANSIRQKCTRKFEKSRMLIHDIEEEIKEAERKKAEEERAKLISEENQVQRQQQQQKESMTVSVGNKYNKPTTKEHQLRRRKSSGGLKITETEDKDEMVIVPIPGTSKSPPPFYKVVRKGDLAEELRRINNRPRILHIPTIYQENTDDEDVYEEDATSSNFPPPPSSSPQPGSGELPPFSVVDFQDGRCGGLANEEPSFKIKELLEDLDDQEVPSLEAANGRDKSRAKRIEVGKIEKLSDVCKMELMKGNESVVKHSARETVPKEKDKRAEKNVVSGPCESASKGTSSRAKQHQNEEDKDDLKAGGDAVLAQTRLGDAPEIPETPDTSPYTFLRAWNAVCKDRTYAKQAELLQSLDTARLAEMVGCKMDEEMLSGMVRTMARHFCVPDRVDKVEEMLVSLARVPRIHIVLMFLGRDDSVALRNVVDFLEQHGRSLPAELKTHLRGASCR